MKDASLGKRYTFRNYHIWADEGMVCLEDQRDGDFIVLTTGQVKERAQVFKEEADLDTGSDQLEKRRLCEALENCVRDAVAQGDPTDDTVRKAKAKALRRQPFFDMSTPGTTGSVGRIVRRPTIFLPNLRNPSA